MRLALASNKELMKLLPLVALWLVGLSAFWLLVMPASRDIDRLEASMHREEQTQLGLQQTIARRPGLEARQSEVDAQIVKIQETIPAQQDLPLVVELLHRVLDAYGIRENRVNYSPISRAENRAFVTMTIRGRGTYTNMVAAIAALGETLPTLRVLEARVSSVGPDTQSFQVTAELSVTDSRRTGRWQQPALPEVTIAGNRSWFHLPFLVLESLVQEVRVLGVVQSDGRSRALIHKGGQERWYSVGERIDEAVIRQISRQGVLADYRGIELFFALRGSR